MNKSSHDLDREPVIVVGGGPAGVYAALELRKLGFQGIVTLISEESRNPYERPRLSKYVGPDALIDISSKQEFDEQQINLMLSERVASIDREQGRVLLSSGRVMPYSKLLIATGAEARKVRFPGYSGKDILYLRDHEDAKKIEGVIEGGGSIALIGGGFIGLELASLARKHGVEVTIVESANGILARGVPPSVAAIAHREHILRGVKIKTGVTITNIERSDRFIISLSNGTELTVDAVIAGVGSAPRVSIAQECGLEVDNGICVDARLRTSDEAIFAAGDCCSIRSSLPGVPNRRFESWRIAQEQGVLAARNILGETPAYDVLPWFWSDQFDFTIQVVGVHTGKGMLVERPISDLATMYIELDHASRMVAASAIGPISKIGKEMRLAEKLIRAGLAVEREEIANPSVRMMDMLRR
ncbi:FAD-dependent oxidoreductase [Shinella sp. S4-D37]|uniref:NAD(P)/FAD-dependent oxidoreductase n=1 Tax=Shinella sp. S4-D37 TaxID=3161999 RepID=UPI0034673F73